MADEAPKRPAPTADFRLGEWLVHPSADRVSTNGTVVHLRPQLTDLLVLLARNAGRTVSKEQMLKEVWAAEFVGESALSRCITELRQALHDDARAPRLIETIPKRGYRLVAPVEFLPDGPAAPSNGNGHGARDGVPCRAGDGHGAPAEPAALHAGPETTPGGAPECPTGEPSDPASPAACLPPAPVTTMVRRARWTALKVVLVGGVAVTFGARDWRPAAVISERDTVLVADITNSTGDRVFDDTLRLALAVNLEQAPFLRILPRDGVRAALARMGRSPDERVQGPVALEVCRREGAALLLAGSIGRLGSRYAVGIEATGCASGEPVARALGEARDKEQVLKVLEDVATRIRVKLGESHASLRQYSIPLAHATTASLQALEMLTLGDDSRDHARVTDALPYYRQATEIDPGFAVAWARRGAAAYTLGLRDEATTAFRRAYDLRQKVSQPERFYIEAHYYRAVEPDPQKAIDTYRAWQRLYPGSLVPPTNLASILSGFMGQYDAALVEAREAVRIGPYSSIAQSQLITALLGTGRVADARQAIAHARSLKVSDRVMHRWLLTLALYDGDRAALDAEIQGSASDPTAALIVSDARAAAAMAGGRLREGRALWSETVARAAESGERAHVAAVRLAWAESEALVGDARRARTAVEAAMAGDPRPSTLVDAARIFAIAGERARARSILDGLSGRDGLNPEAVLVFLPVARALVESKAGQDTRAIAILQAIASFERGSEFGPAPLGVRALVHMSAGRPRDAVAALDELLRLRPLYPADAWVPFARLARARALRDAGDTAGALAAYDAFLESWRDADRDAPLLTVAQGERAALASR